MLIFAVFTIGFMLGIFLTLSVFVPKAELEVRDSESATSHSPIAPASGMSPWVVHSLLIKPNSSLTKGPVGSQAQVAYN